MSPFRRGGMWWASIPQPGGGRRRVSLETDNKAEATRREAEMRNAAERERLGLEVRQKNPRGLTLAEAVDLHLETSRVKRQAQHARLKLTLAKHIQRDPIGAIRLEAITSGTIVEWLDRREEEGCSPTTANRLKANLSAIFSNLIERKIWLGDNPTEGVRARKQKRPADKALPAWAIPALIEAAPTDGWRLAFALAAYTGMRRGEIERLKWADVDLDARIIRVRETKTDVLRLVGIHRELVALLKDARGTGLVIPRAGWSKSAVVVRNALARAGVDVDVRGTFHGLRSTWASRMIDCGADPFMVRLMGWGPPPGDVMATHYVRPSVAYLDAIDKLNWPTGKVLGGESHFGHRGRV